MRLVEHRDKSLNVEEECPERKATVEGFALRPRYAPGPFLIFFEASNPKPLPCSSAKNPALSFTSRGPFLSLIVSMKIVSAGSTNIGRKRKVNQDSFLMEPGSKLFVVADGMGGHAGGETA